jgi:hypothetical protein
MAPYAEVLVRENKEVLMRPSVALMSVFCLLVATVHSRAAVEDSPLFDRSTREPFQNRERFKPIEFAARRNVSCKLDGPPNQRVVRVIEEYRIHNVISCWEGLLDGTSLELAKAKLVLHLTLRDAWLTFNDFDEYGGVVRQHAGVRAGGAYHVVTFTFTLFGNEK